MPDTTQASTLEVTNPHVDKMLWAARALVAHSEAMLHASLNDPPTYDQTYPIYENAIDLCGKVEALAFQGRGFKFTLGIVRYTPGVTQIAQGLYEASAGVPFGDLMPQMQFDEVNRQLHPYIVRHVTGDWGDLGAEDQAANRAAIEGGGRVLSKYEIAGADVYVITEANRSVTTMMLTSEY